MSAHSILPPSGAAAWRRCGLWVTMNQKYPKPDTPETLEGNAAHWVAWEMQAGRPVTEGESTSNGVIVTQEMLEGGELIVETINQRMPFALFGAPYIEERVAVPRINLDCYGTPDVWAFSKSTMTLELIDYKFGHRFVDEYENDQCVTYVAGILDLIDNQLGTLGVGLLDQAIQVNITIVQPRCFYKGAPVRTWSVRASDLRPQINILSNATEVALSRNPPAMTNSECVDCPGRHACPALQKAAYSDAEFAVNSAPVELTPEAASLELRILERAQERLQSRVEGMREVVLSFIRAGHRVPFHHTEQSYGRQEWTLPPEQIISLGQMLNVDLSKKAVKTPKQAKILGVDEAVIKAYSVTPSGSLKLVSDNPADVRRTFGIK